MNGLNLTSGYRRESQELYIYIPEEGVPFLIYLLNPLWSTFQLPKILIVNEDYIQKVKPEDMEKLDDPKGGFIVHEDRCKILLVPNKNNMFSIEVIIHEICHYCHYKNNSFRSKSDKYYIEEFETIKLSKKIMRVIRKLFKYIQRSLGFNLLPIKMGDSLQISLIKTLKPIFSKKAIH